MAELQGDNATNSAGTGPVNFPFGLTLPASSVTEAIFTDGSATTATYVDVVTSVLPEGTWLILSTMRGSMTAGAEFSLRFLLSNTAGNVVGDSVFGVTAASTLYIATTTTQQATQAIQRLVVVPPSTTTTIYTKYYIDSNAGGSFSIEGVTRCVKIA